MSKDKQPRMFQKGLGDGKKIAAKPSAPSTSTKTPENAQGGAKKIGPTKK